MTDLRPIQYTREPVTPLPEVIREGNTEMDWLLYDEAMAAQEFNTAAARAARMAQQGEKT